MDIEFVLSIIVFLSIISFVTYVIISNIPVFRTEAAAEDIRSKSYEISQLLLLDKGTKNWAKDVSNGVPLDEVRIGLSSERRYVLEATKVEVLDGLCNDAYGYGYKDVRDWVFGPSSVYDVRINVTDGIETLAFCGPIVSRTQRPEFQTVRFAALDDGRIVKLLVSVS